MADLESDYGPTLYRNLGFSPTKQLLYPAAWLTLALGLNGENLLMALEEASIANLNSHGLAPRRPLPTKQVPCHWSPRLHGDLDHRSSSW